MDKAYFENYCGHGPYRDHYRLHSGVDHCIWICRRCRVPVRSVVVLGAATGEILSHFWRAWRIRPDGCEVSRWAHAEIPKRYRGRIARADMRDWVPRVLAAGGHYDLVFTNALVYVPAEELPPLVAQLAELAGHFHFWSSTTEDFEPGDRYRTTLRPNAWWRALFEDGGFEPTRSKYLWRSRRARGRSPETPEAPAASNGRVPGRKR